MICTPAQAKTTTLPTFKSKQKKGCFWRSGYPLWQRERAQIVWEVALLLLHILAPLSLSPQFELFATWFLSIQLFWGFFATARQVTLAEGVSGRRRHEKERPRRLTLQSTPSAMPQNPFAQFSSVSHLPFQVFYPCILWSSLPPAPCPKTQSQPHFPHFSSVFPELFKHISTVFSFIMFPSSDLIQNRFKRLTTTQNNYVVILCGFLDINIFDKFSHGNKYLLICWIRITRLFNF